MKNTSKTILVLFLLFFGLAETQAAANDCLLDVFQAELKEKNSKELNNYLSDKLNKSKEDLNKAFEAWKVLYQADKKVDRLNIENLETVYAFMASAEKTVEEMVENIKLANGFESWKNLDYQFQKEGYTYVQEEDIKQGYKVIKHKIQKNGKIEEVGGSRITSDGILRNSFEIPEELQGKRISKAIYTKIFEENDIRVIKSYFIEDKGHEDNYKVFMDVYNATKDAEKAAMATPQGRVIGNLFKPVDIEIANGEIFITWVKRSDIKGTVKTSSKPEKIMENLRKIYTDCE